MKAIDAHAEKFEELLNYPNRSAELAMRLPIENQVLFDFFANALAALESFCFASYYVAAAIDSTRFSVHRNPRKIDYNAVSACFKTLDPTDGFTIALSECSSSQNFQLLKAMRNMLLHKLQPGRTIQLGTSAPDKIDFYLWHEGDWSRAKGGTMTHPKLNFLLESDALVKLRDWIDGQLELLSSALEALAGKHGLK